MSSLTDLTQIMDASARIADTVLGVDMTPDLSDAVDNPLDSVERTGDEEADTVAEASALLTAFKARSNERDAHYKTAMDSEFWFAVCFATREQKDAFLQAKAWVLAGDKYLDGAVVAELMGVELPPKPSWMKKKSHVKKGLASLAE